MTSSFNLNIMCINTFAVEWCRAPPIWSCLVVVCVPLVCCRSVYFYMYAFIHLHLGCSWNSSKQNIQNVKQCLSDFVSFYCHHFNHYMVSLQRATQHGGRDGEHRGEEAVSRGIEGGIGGGVGEIWGRGQQFYSRAASEPLGTSCRYDRLNRNHI